jgi:undecaprenyl-diphosphatase
MVRMDIIQTVLLGLVQGLTEFIPVSSSGHLVIAQQLLSGSSDHLYIEFINGGTLLALLVYFRGKITQLVGQIVAHRDTRLLRNIILTSLPAGLVGFFLADFIARNRFFGNVWVVIVALAVVGVMMLVLDRLPRASKVMSGSELTWQRALMIGVAQACALVPGVSRSGSTIIAGRLAGLNHADAAVYSFMASIPIMVAVTLKLFISTADRAYFVEHMPMLLLGNLVAFIAGIAAIRFMLRYLASHDLSLFGWYRLALAAVTMGVLLLQ